MSFAEWQSFGFGLDVLQNAIVPSTIPINGRPAHTRIAPGAHFTNMD